jgi:hypothetical protein
MASTRDRGARRRFVPDPRLIIGLVLVAGSVAGVLGIVAASDDSVVVYAARAPLTAGDRVHASDLDQRSVRLDAAGGLYLRDGDIPQGGLVVTRTVAPGELVPASATGSVQGMRLTSIVLSVQGRLAASVGHGSIVDVWGSHETSNGVFAAPAVIVGSAEVVRIVASEGFVASDASTNVEVLVPRARVARVLEAVAAGDVLSVVPAHLPAGG